MIKSEVPNGASQCDAARGRSCGEEAWVILHFVVPGAVLRERGRAEEPGRGRDGPGRARPGQERERAT